MRALKSPWVIGLGKLAVLVGLGVSGLWVPALFALLLYGLWRALGDVFDALAPARSRDEAAR